MINSIIAQIKQEYLNKGFKSLIQPVSISVNKRIQSINLGNDRYVLTGCTPSEDDITQDMHSIEIISANNAIETTQRQIQSIGTSVVQSFIRNIEIKTTKKDRYYEDDPITPYQLHFIKITPIKNKA